REGAFLLQRLLAAAQPLSTLAFERMGERRKKTEIDVHRLVRARGSGRRAGGGLDVAAGDMREQGAMRRGRRRRSEQSPEPFGRGEASRNQADGGGLHIPLTAGDLAGKAQPRLDLEAQGVIEQLRRVEEGIAVKAAKPRELRVLEAWDRAEDARLLAVLELGLKPDDVEEGPEPVVLAQLNDGIGLDVRRMRVGEAERFHRAVAQSFAAALRHHLDGQATVEIGRLPVVESNLVAAEQGFDERLVSFPR